MSFNNLDYSSLVKSVYKIVKKYPFVDVFSCGKTVMDRDILCLKFGKGNKKIFLNATHHSLEWITSSLLLSYTNDFLECLKKEDAFCGYDILDIYKKASFYIIPMVNPDGVEIVKKGVSKKGCNYTLVKNALNGKKASKVWQANANGVDLNHNYDASFYEGKDVEKELGIFSPSPTRFSGLFPFSEPETRAIKDLVEKENFDICLAFHSQGEVIYWNYNDLGYFDMAKRLSKVSGYKLDTIDGMASYSGFKDWMLEKYNIPSFTIEVGVGKNPIKYAQFDKIKKDCYKIINECCYL